jgi:hypothetical protein
MRMRRSVQTDRRQVDFLNNLYLLAVSALFDGLDSQIALRADRTAAKSANMRKAP